MKIKTEYYLADVDKEKIIKKRKAFLNYKEDLIKFYQNMNPKEVYLMKGIPSGFNVDHLLLYVNRYAIKYNLPYKIVTRGSGIKRKRSWETGPLSSGMGWRYVFLKKRNITQEEIMNFKDIKELQSIQMRKDIKVLESYSFNCASMSKYIGDISDRAIREFVGDRARSLNNRNHERLRVWLEQIKTEINRLEEE